MLALCNISIHCYVHHNIFVQSLEILYNDLYNIDNDSSGYIAYNVYIR